MRGRRRSCCGRGARPSSGTRTTAKWSSLAARIVQTLGPERTLALLAQAEAVEARGGLTLPDGRRRTPGGVFFRLAREQATPDERARIWPWTRGPKPAAKPRRSGR